MKMTNTCPACGYGGHFRVDSVDYAKGILVMSAEKLAAFYPGMIVDVASRRTLVKRLRDAFAAFWMAWTRDR